MNSGHTIPEGSSTSRKRPRPRDQDEDEDVEMTDCDEPARQIARPSSRVTMTKASKDCKDEDILVDVMDRPTLTIGSILVAEKARDSMSPGSPGSPAKGERKIPAVQPAPRPTSLTGFHIPPGGRLFRRPSIFTGTHFIVNSNRQIELALRVSRQDGNEATQGTTQKQVATAKADFRSWCPDFLQLCAQMLLSKQDAAAKGFDWSVQDFQQLYYQINGWSFPIQFASKLSAQAREHILHMLCEQATRRAAGSSRPILGSDLTAIINGLPDPAALPSVRDAKQRLPSVASDSGRSNVILPKPPPPDPPIRQNRNQRPAPPTLASQVESNDGQSLPSRDLNWRRGANRPTRAERPTRSFERREERERRRSDSVTGATQRLTIHGIYECCCPHCGFAVESYVKFKRHMAEHFEKDGWTEYRCPMKGCDESFAKPELSQYMRYLESQGLIQMKREPPRDPISHFYFKFKWHIRDRDMRRAREYEMARLQIRNNFKVVGEERKVRDATNERDVDVDVDADADDDDDEDDDEDAWLDEIELPEA